MDTEKELREVFQDIFKAPSESINYETKQNELEGWDSLGQLRLIMAVENKFHISFTINEIAELKTFGLILNKLNAPVSK
ncbi:MAG: acyl carrier protein [Paludibacteraceae bacterium]